MMIIGITGGIGSGKSVVCSVFNHLGIPVYESDKAAHLLYEDPILIEKISTVVSADAIDKNGKVNRKKLAEIVFNDSEKLELLNGIVHPAVQSDFKKWTGLHKGFSYVIKEAAILFESGAYKQCDKIIAIASPAELRISRVRERDHKSKADVEQIISRQMPEEERNKRADFIIYNDEKQLVIPQVLALHFQLQKLNEK